MIVQPGTKVLNKWGDEFMALSIKGVVEEDGKIWLRRNEWKKWELPGGRLEAGEQPEQTVVREIEEELGLKVRVEQIVDVQVWRKDFGNNPVIGIVTFTCQLLARTGPLELKGEAGPAEFAQFSPAEALALEDLPDIYKRAIQMATRVK